ncbi:halocyanin [Halobacteriales archaeon SW_12_69_24]|nr:MAG: halocyanin [Halobacteriales archaeon SW_12_69_24]
MPYSRRRYLALATVGSAALAGCAGDEERPNGTSTDRPEKTPSSTPADNGTPRPTKESRTATDTDTRGEPTDGSGPDGSPTETETPTDSETPTPTDTETQTETETPTDTEPAGQDVVVGPNGLLVFQPEEFTISAGATVTWEWDSDGHNVRPSSTPGGSDWSGTPGGDGTTYDEGYVHEHTFTTTGTYEYYCAPHRGAGMTGSFTVE